MPKIYFDNAATTPVDNAVVQAMLPYFESSFGNASSVHSYGLEAKHVLDSARATVADALKSKHHEIIFTSGGTEANNLAILGIANKYHSPQHIITSFIEHPSVLQPCKYLEKAGWQVTYLPVDAFGELNPQKLVEAIRDDTVLISLMTVNNETGVIQPVDKLAEIADAHNVPFHSDAVQAFGKTPIDLQKYKVSFLTISGHKIYGPKGVGALFIRKGMKLISTLIGGEQENKQRAGTENIPAIAGFAKAVELAFEDEDNLRSHLIELGDKFICFMQEKIPGAILNGNPENRVPGIVNYSFPGIDSLSMVMGLDLKGIAVSNGSACSSGNLEPSQVLQAMQLPKSRQTSAIRFSFGKFNTLSELEKVQSALLDLTKGRLMRKA